MPDYAIVRVHRLNLREQPGTTSPIVKRLPYGTRVELLSDPAAEWVLVHVADLTGYVASAFIVLESDTPQPPEEAASPLKVYLNKVPDYALPDGYAALWKYQKKIGLPDPFAVLPVQLNTEREVQRLWLNGFGPNYFAYMNWTGWYTRTAGIHSGFDYMVKQNTPLLAVSDGVIVHGWRFLRNPYDRTLALWCFLPEKYRDEQGRRMMSNVLVAYAHMNNNGVRQHLEVVQAGDIVGYSGTPGGVGSNAHLHLEVHLLEGDPNLPFARQPEKQLLKEFNRPQIQNNNTPWNSLLFFSPRLIHYLMHQDKLYGHAGKAPGYPTPEMLRRFRFLPPLDLFTLAYYRYDMPIVWNNLNSRFTPDVGAMTTDLLRARLKIFPTFEPYEAWFL